MIRENSIPKLYCYRPREGYEARCLRRLQKDLGLDEAGAETILRLHRQVLELQSRLRELEAELDAQSANLELRLAHTRKVCYEATGIELETRE